MGSDKKEWLNVKETAELLGIKKSALYRWCDNLDIKLTFYRIGGLVKFDKKDVLKFIEDSKVEK